MSVRTRPTQGMVQVGAVDPNWGEYQGLGRNFPFNQHLCHVDLEAVAEAADGAKIPLRQQCNSGGLSHGHRWASN